ncbi:hypothetical protein ACSPX5_14030 [Pseudomonas sp. HLG18]|uniref:hypothetical protein n=1 Tax=Pseudomonas sp. HLG18 TaxID=3449277 RepID=UPI003F747869
MADLSIERKLVLAAGMRTKFVRDLGAEEYELYRRHSAIIRNFSKDHELLRLVVRAFEAFKKFMKNSVETIRSNAELNQEALVDYSFEPGALLLEYLNTTRIFVDHFKAKIIRLYGQDSAEFSNYEKLLNLEFDECFSYRFLYKLRNYTTHCGLPLLNFKLSRMPGEHASLIITMKPKDLLVSYSGWGAIVGKDLESKEDDIYLWPLLSENVDSVVYFFHTLYGDFYRDEALESLDWMCTFLGSNSPEVGLAIAEGDMDDRGLPAILEFVVIRQIRSLMETEQEFLARSEPL